MFFNKKLKNYRLTNDFQKFFLLKKIGIDFVINKSFDLKFSKITSEQFIKKIIVKKINPEFIFVSSNFRYGNKRKGDVKELIAEGKKYGFNIIKPEPLRIKKQVVSSTLIRGLLKKGHFADICVFSLDEISDEATFKKPHQYSRGVEHVIVNGVFVVENNKRTKKTPGRLIRSNVD